MLQEKLLVTVESGRIKRDTIPFCPTTWYPVLPDHGVIKTIWRLHKMKRTNSTYLM